MKKISFVLFMLLLAAPALVFAQEAAADAQTEDGSLAPVYKEYVLDSFEEESLWKVEVSGDVGYQTTRHLSVQPAAKQDAIVREFEPQNPANLIDQNDQALPADDKVLGIKIDFLKRSWDSIIIKPDAPIQLRGTVKSISFLCAGRLYKHNLNLLLRNYDGDRIVVPAGQLYHYGWKRISVDIPEMIDQTDPHYPKRIGGLVFEGFEIKLNAMDIDESYYVYFDDLRMVSDVSADEFDGLHFFKEGTEEYKKWEKHLDEVKDRSEIRFDYRNDMEDNW